MSGVVPSNIHRYLDEAFAGVAMTAELQDLKEEVRSNLLERVAELKAAGVPVDKATATAVAELGDLGEIIGQETAAAAGDPVSPAVVQAREYSRNRVKPRSGFVIGIVLLSVVALAALLLFVLVVGTSGGAATAVLAGFALAVSAGAVVTWSLRQETSQNFPIPPLRALFYGAAAAAAVVGLALCALVGEAGAGVMAAGIFVVLGSVVGFIKLGISQTNRKKPWVRAVQRDFEGQDRFSQDPASAARFGIYTGVIWIVAFALFVVLSFSVGLAWSWLALLAALTATMVALARMLFPAHGPATRKNDAAPNQPSS